MHWRLRNRACVHCGERFAPAREAQVYCQKKCANAATQMRKRQRSGDSKLESIPVPRSGDSPVSVAPTPLSDGSTVVWPTRDEQRGPTPGALQGDDYPLTYDENGYPELPACLDGRKPKLRSAA